MGQDDNGQAGLEISAGLTRRKGPAAVTKEGY